MYGTEFYVKHTFIMNREIIPDQTRSTQHTTTNVEGCVLLVKVPKR